MPAVSLALIDSFPFLNHHAFALLPILVHPEVLRLLIKLILDPPQPLVLHLSELLTPLFNRVLLVLPDEVQSMLIKLVLVPQLIGLILYLPLFLHLAVGLS